MKSNGLYVFKNFFGDHSPRANMTNLKKKPSFLDLLYINVIFIFGFYLLL
jgi:hypothetical protein